jgi:hypothetical protein
VHAGGDAEGVRAVSTLVSPAPGHERAAAGGERRARERDGGERPADRAIDRERLLAKRAQVAEGDYFAILGVERTASAHEIRRAFERLRADFAPERFATLRDELDGALDEIHEVIDEAYRVLSDDDVRAAYRGHLD